jgi:hypothetical protein
VKRFGKEIVLVAVLVGFAHRDRAGGVTMLGVLVVVQGQYRLLRRQHPAEKQEQEIGDIGLKATHRTKIKRDCGQFHLFKRFKAIVFSSKKPSIRFNFGRRLRLNKKTPEKYRGDWKSQYLPITEAALPR